jgi:hypothetical protein
MEQKHMVDAKRVAKELGLTGRRVHQLVEELVLPPANNAKLFDLERCALRYKLFKHGRFDQWENFYDSVEQAAKDTAPKVERALQDDPTDEEISVALRAHLSLYSDMKFLAVCRSKTGAEKNLFLDLWQREEDRIAGGLLYQMLRGRALVDDFGKMLIPGKTAT